jgi:hypothetical protein
MNVFRDNIRHWNLEEDALDCTCWRTRFGKGKGPVSKETVV